VARSTRSSHSSFGIRSRLVRYAAGFATAALALAGCGSGSHNTGAATNPKTATASEAGGSAGAAASGTLTIALQPDLGYAALYIVKQEGWLDQALPNVHVVWQTLNSGSAIETGMVSGRIDVGAGGIAPFLLGADSGVGWKLLASLGESNLELVAKPEIKTLHDFKSSDRIAVVAPTSIQAIVLKKAAQKELGSPTALDRNMVIMPHAVARQSFIAHSISAALDAPPFEQDEVASGGHVLISSYDLFGQSTFNSAFALSSFYASHTKELQVLEAQIERALNMLQSDPKQAAQIVSDYEKGSLSAADAYKDITNSSEKWTVTPHGYLAYAKFMHSIGLLKKVPASMSDLELPTLSKHVGD
jgi:NitT/TauT family transport system substrate-binding protein